MNKSSYYDLLGIESSATIHQIKKSYKAKAHQYHPDKNISDDNTMKFQEINEAYEVLSNLEKRRIYDNFGENDYSAILNQSEENYEFYFNFLDNDEMKYNANLHTMICDCEDWIKKRSIYPANDPRRLCRHLILEFNIFQLDTIALPEYLKPFQNEILLNRYQKVGFTIYKELIYFNSSIVTINDDETKICLYVKEHLNQNCLFSTFNIKKDSSGSYVWNVHNTNVNEITFKNADKKLLDSKEYINNRFNIKNKDIVLCQSSTESMIKEKINSHKAFKDGYLLSKLFEYSISNYVQNSNIKEAIKKRKKYGELRLKELSKFDTLENLINLYKSRFTIRSFNKKLTDLEYLAKDKTINNNNWILKGDGLKYGMNSIYNSKYTHIKTPEWYVITRFEFKSLSFEEEKRYGLKRMTRVMFKKETFKELLDLMNQYILPTKPKKQISVKVKEEIIFLKLKKTKKSTLQMIKDLIIG